MGRLFPMGNVSCHSQQDIRKGNDLAFSQGLPAPAGFSSHRLSPGGRFSMTLPTKPRTAPTSWPASMSSWTRSRCCRRGSGIHRSESSPRKASPRRWVLPKGKRGGGGAQGPSLHRHKRRPGAHQAPHRDPSHSPGEEEGARSAGGQRLPQQGGEAQRPRAGADGEVRAAPGRAGFAGFPSNLSAHPPLWGLCPWMRPQHRCPQPRLARGQRCWYRL